MSKINELKNLRSSFKNDNNSEINIMNISNNSIAVNKQNKNNSRIEIDANIMAEQFINNKTNNESMINTGNIENNEKTLKKNNKIFMTEHHLKFDNKELYSFHDMIVPGGKNESYV